MPVSTTLSKTQKPAYGPLVIDPSHPLRRGLMLEALLNEGAGPPRDTAGGITSVRTGGTWITSQIGEAMSITTGGDNFEFPAGDLWGTRITTSATWEILFNPSNFSSGYRTLVDNANGIARAFCMQFPNGTQIHIAIPGTTVDMAYTMTAGLWYHLVAVYDDVAHTATLYKNGAQSSTTGLTRSGSYLTAPNNFGANPSGGGDNFVGSYGLVRLWNRTLSAAEAQAVTFEPYAST